MLEVRNKGHRQTKPTLSVSSPDKQLDGVSSLGTDPPTLPCLVQGIKRSHKGNLDRN